MIPTEVNVVLNDIWPMLLLFIIVVCTIRIIDVIINKKKFTLYKDLFTLAFVLYMFLLFELVTSTDFESFSNNFIPFKEISRYNLSSPLFYKNVIGNVLLFVPFGYFINTILKNKSILLNILITIITSTSIECIQMFIGRSFDIDDIILNVIGGTLGYLTYRVLDIIKEKLPPCLKKDWIFNIIWIIIILLGIFIVLEHYRILQVL